MVASMPRLCMPVYDDTAVVPDHAIVAAGGGRERGIGDRPKDEQSYLGAVDDLRAGIYKCRNLSACYSRQGQAHPEYEAVAMAQRTRPKASLGSQS